MPTVPMLAPDGSSGDIPQENVAAATAKGFKPAVVMTAPDGKTGYIPIDRQQDALGAGFKPLGPPADTRSMWQKAKDNFNSNTQGAQSGESPVVSAIHNFSQGGGDVIRSLAHPIDTISSMARNIPGMVDSTGILAHALGTPTAQDQITSGVSQAVHQPMRTLGQIGTGAILGEAGGAAFRAVAPMVGDAAAAAKMRLRPVSSPDIVPPAEIQAQKIAQSILPPGGIKPELVQAIQEQAPAIKEYAARTGNPLNTQAEGLKAAQGVAQEGLQHYKTEVLDPVAQRSVVLDPANTDLGAKATLGQIDTRITQLNKLTNTAPAASQGAALDVLAKSKWTDEVAYLRQKLYSSLEHTTGIPADDIQQLREGYGGEFSLANGLESAQNARLTRTGQLTQGQQSISLKRPSILELPGQVVQAVRGGEQAIADRQFSSAMKGVQPEAPTRPMPPPIDSDAIAAQQQAAQQEFLRQHQLEQSAQDASSGRSQAVNTYRGEQSTNNNAAAQIEATKMLQSEQSAQDSAAGRDQRVSGYRNAQQLLEDSKNKFYGENSRATRFRSAK